MNPESADDSKTKLDELLNAIKDIPGVKVESIDIPGSDGTFELPTLLKQMGSSRAGIELAKCRLAEVIASKPYIKLLALLGHFELSILAYLGCPPEDDDSIYLDGATETYERILNYVKIGRPVVKEDLKEFEARCSKEDKKGHLND